MLCRSHHWLLCQRSRVCRTPLVASCKQLTLILQHGSSTVYERVTIQVYWSKCLTFTLMNIHDHVSLIKAALVSMDFNLSEFNNIGTIYYRPQRSCDQGYVFTRVCDSVHRAGVCPIACWDIYPPSGPRQTPLQTKVHTPT